MVEKVLEKSGPIGGNSPIPRVSREIYFNRYANPQYPDCVMRSSVSP